MFPPVFTTAIDSSTVLARLGSSPTRLYPFGEAPQNVVKPYSVWQIVSGSPYNQLAGIPGMDRFTTQHDVYADTASDARSVAQALRDAFEPVAYVVSWRGESIDRETNNYRYSFDVEWHIPRGGK